MHLEEPPFLSIGTEVSAKCKGAFCEAKIKNISKLVKCKVRQLLNDYYLISIDFGYPNNQTHFIFLRYNIQTDQLV